MAAEAVRCIGKASMTRKQTVLIEHTESLKHIMFNNAKNMMLTLFRKLIVCSLLHLKFKNENSLGKISYSGELITLKIFKLNVSVFFFFARNGLRTG